MGRVVKTSGEPDLLGELVELAPAAESASLCMQCGTCTAGCPAAAGMQFTPRQVVHLLQLGEVEAAVRTDGIWACLNCYNCTVRCPREIKVSEIFEGLRTMAFNRGITPARDRAYHESFLRVVESHGRVFEAEMMARLALRTNPLGLLKQAPTGLAMFRRGKLALRPHRSRGVRKIGRRFLGRR